MKDILASIITPSYYCSVHIPVTLSNVRSLRNKVTELSSLLTFDSDYRKTSLFCFTETWMTRESEDINLNGFQIVRSDRDPAKTRQRPGKNRALYGSQLEMGG